MGTSTAGTTPFAPEDVAQVWPGKHGTQLQREVIAGLRREGATFEEIAGIVGLSPDRCRDIWHSTVVCSPRRRPYPYSTEKIIAAIQRWTKIHGEPPAASDWMPGTAISRNMADRAEMYYGDYRWPNASTVINRFGSWNAAIAAAGFAPLPQGVKRR